MPRGGKNGMTRRTALTTTAAAAATAATASSPALAAHPIPDAVPASGEEPMDDWGVGSALFSTATADAEAKPRKRAMSAAEKGRSWRWMSLGGLLHLTAIGMLVAWLAGVFDSSPKPEPEPPKPSKKDEKPPIRKNQPARG